MTSPAAFSQQFFPQDANSLKSDAERPPIAPLLLPWFERHGRKDLPWHRNPSPYRVWVSEVMLQQTQVATVIPYFERFMARFPTLRKLAAAAVDDVLAHWSGLGYYARARNLHRAATVICDRFAGEFPTDFDRLTELPGIGRSTAGAVLALSCGQRHPILDGNAKRVLARYHGVTGWPGESPVSKRLWYLAETETPAQGVASYTQAIMDLGATVCVRSRPLCTACPLAIHCRARLQSATHEIPGRRPRRQRPLRQLRLLMVRDERGCVLLERRPPVGVWGGLWSLPECEPGQDPVACCDQRLGLCTQAEGAYGVLEHEFTHFRLRAEIVALRLRTAAGVLEGPSQVWYNPAAPVELGLAAPVQRLLCQLPKQR